MNNWKLTKQFLGFFSRHRDIAVFALDSKRSIAAKIAATAPGHTKGMPGPLAGLVFRLPLMGCGGAIPETNGRTTTGHLTLFNRATPSGAIASQARW